MTDIDSTDPIHVVLAADANYTMPLAVTICSAVANCGRNREMVFHVFEKDIDPSLRKKVEISVTRAGSCAAEINWLAAPMHRFNDLRVTHHWITPLTFVRLLVPELLPTEVDKAIYMDCDAVVVDDLSKLWDTDVDGKSLFAARDLIGWVSDPNAGICNYRELGIPEKSKYFNAGILLVNLKKWRRQDTSQRLLNYLKNYRDIIRASDQEALNAVLFDDWGELDFRWNWQIIPRYYRIGTHKMGWSPPPSRKSIIHFHSEEKPWLPGCDYDEKKVFFEYLDRTEWAGWRVPLYMEVYGRTVRPLNDARNALGRLRRHWGLRVRSRRRPHDVENP